MRLGVVLMCCLFILCFTRAAEKPLLRLGHTCASWAAISLMLLALNAFTLRPLVELSINPASILLCVLTALAAMKSSGFLSLLKALALAVPAGLLMLAISRLMASGYINLAEPGLVLALCGTVFMAMLRQSPAAALFGVSLAPLLLAVFEAALDLYAFGYTVMLLGTPVAFDAQVAGLFLTGMLFAFVLYRGERRAGIKKAGRASARP